MIVVSDTTPLNYLILIGRVEILRSLYNEVVIPPAVVTGVLVRLRKRVDFESSGQ